MHKIDGYGPTKNTTTKTLVGHTSTGLPGRYAVADGAQGIDSMSLHRYVAHGWLRHLIRGVYRRPLPFGVNDSAMVLWESVLL